jgi:DNA polymerase-3 subunit delta'
MWADCIEQKQLALFLQQSLRNGHVAHAYLFAGPKGSGKRKMALQLAKGIFCREKEGDSCDQCENCRRIDSGNHPDVHIIEPEGTRIKISQIQDLQKEFSYRAMESFHKVYIMEHGDKMTTEAANRLLKFLEEPPPGAVAILLTEQINSILPTILSRCQILYFAPLNPQLIVDQLVAKGFPPGIARVAAIVSGSLAEGEKLCAGESFAQVRGLVIQLSEDIVERGTYSLITLHERILKRESFNEEVNLFLDLLLLWLRDLLFYLLGQEPYISNLDQMETIQKQAKRWGQNKLVNGMEKIMETQKRLSGNTNVQLCLEDLVLRLQEGS